MIGAIHHEYCGFDESDPYTKKTKSVQLIYIFKNVGLINQAPTRMVDLINQNPTDEASPYIYIIFYLLHKVGLINQAPTRMVDLINQNPTDEASPYIYIIFYLLHKVGLINQAPTRMVDLMNQNHTRIVGLMNQAPAKDKQKNEKAQKELADGQRKGRGFPPAGRVKKSNH